MKRKLVEACIGEGERSCDVCGRVESGKVFVSIYHGLHGEKTDYCPRCFGGKIDDKRR